MIIASKRTVCFQCVVLPFYHLGHRSVPHFLLVQIHFFSLLCTPWLCLHLARVSFPLLISAGSAPLPAGWFSWGGHLGQVCSLSWESESKTWRLTQSDRIGPAHQCHLELWLAHLAGNPKPSPRAAAIWHVIQWKPIINLSFRKTQSTTYTMA